MKRRRLGESEGRYYERPSVACIPTGCTLLDQVLGGGWAEKRVANVVGDTSTGKSLCAIEAAANFLQKYPNGTVHYIETEAAFDRKFAESIGLPKKRVKLIQDIIVLEEFCEKALAICRRKAGEPALIILDSLDALTSKAEQARDFGQGTYGMEKPKMLSEFFRSIVREMEETNTTLLVVSQVRDNIGVMFGDRHKRGGGKALDFYASQVVWLAKIKQLDLTKDSVKRTVGVQIRAKCKKNKIAAPFRSADFRILFNYGTDDVWSNLNWLIDNKKLDKIDMSIADAKKLLTRLDRLSDEQFEQVRDDTVDAVKEGWKEIEDLFAPKRRKYG